MVQVTIRKRQCINFVWITFLKFTRETIECWEWGNLSTVYCTLLLYSGWISGWRRAMILLMTWKLLIPPKEWYCCFAVRLWVVRDFQFVYNFALKKLRICWWMRLHWFIQNVYWNPVQYNTVQYLGGISILQFISNIWAPLTVLPHPMCAEIMTPYYTAYQ